MTVPNSASVSVSRRRIKKRVRKPFIWRQTTTTTTTASSFRLTTPPSRLLVAAMALVLIFYYLFFLTRTLSVHRREKEGTGVVSPEKLLVVSKKNQEQNLKPNNKKVLQPPKMKRNNDKRPAQLRGGAGQEQMGKKQNTNYVKNKISTNNNHNNATTTFAIPNILIFTHSVDLLNTSRRTTASVDKLRGEDVALRKNVLHTIQLHPTATVRFLTDEDCIQSIRNVLGDSTPLVEFFKKESHGMYKADICRGAALYETGGLYFDVDLQVRMSLLDYNSKDNNSPPVIRPDTKFVVPVVHRDSKHKNAFFQAFIGASPQNPILLRYLELFIKHYQGKIDVQGPLGVLLLRQAYHQVVEEKTQEQGSIIPTQLWQEVLYKSQLFPKVPPPTWGKRRACKFVVVADSKNTRTGEYVVPFYSRVKGSRMCGGPDTNKHG